MIEKDFDMEVFAYMQFFSHCWFLRTSLGPVLAHLASRHWLTTDPLGPLFGHTTAWVHFKKETTGYWNGRP